MRPILPTPFGDRPPAPCCRGPMGWLLVTLLAVTLTGCKGKDESESTNAPPGGPPPGAPGTPPGGPTPGAAPGSPGTTSGTPAATSPDAVMARKVKNALMTGKVDASKVNVEVKDGTVTLSGTVPTASQKSLAEKAAKQVPGVTSVKDDLTAASGK